MRKLLFATLLIILSACGKSSIEADYNAVIPLPQQIQETSRDYFLLNADATICYTSDNGEIQEIAKFLNEYIKVRHEVA